MVPDLVTNAVSWLFNSLYVLIALAVVYLFFFRFVPIVLKGVKEWTIFSVINVSIVLLIMALLLGGVAVHTANWIFMSTLENLENTPMVGVLEDVASKLPNGDSTTDTTYGRTSSTGNNTDTVTQPQSLGTSAPPNIDVIPPNAVPGIETTIKLHDNAMSCWLKEVLAEYDETGNITGNSKVMSESDIPEGMRCEVGAVDGSVRNLWNWGFASSETWSLSCQHPDLRQKEEFQLNGTAARGLTGGDFYGIENQKTVFGTGQWPQNCYDVVEVERVAAPAPSSIASESNGPDGSGGDGEVVSVGRSHTVSPGESLIVIANMYNTTAQALVNANKQTYSILGTNPNMLQPGWELIIP